MAMSRAIRCSSSAQPFCAWRGSRLFVMRCSHLAFVLLTAGCSGYWGRRPINHPAPVERLAPVWIWSGGEVNKWHAVVITQDSVSGIPYRTSLKCDSCRRSIPRARVDSMTLGYQTNAEKLTEVGGVLTGAFLALAALCWISGGHGQCS